MLTAIPLDWSNHLGNAVEWRDTRLVELADAAVLVGEPTEEVGLLERAAAKGIRLVALGVEPREPKEPAPLPPERPRFPSLPD